MRNSLFINNTFFKTACYFEASLCLPAFLLGWLTQINPLAHFYFSSSALLYGVLGTVPLFAWFLVMHKLPGQSIAAIRELLLKTLGPSFQAYQWPHFLLLASIAGISEELLFRGFLQPWLASFLGSTAGLLLSNVLFGMVHSITPLYALLASLVGIYLGLAMEFSGESNLLTPILIHGLYDFLAITALIHQYRGGLLTTQK